MTQRSAHCSLYPPRSVLRVISLSFALGALVSGCTPRAAKRPGEQLEVQVAQAPKVSMDPEIEEASSTFYSFLTGQLALERADFEKARREFQKVSKQTNGSVPVVDKRLADLQLRSGDLERALAEVEKITVAEPTNEEYALLKAGLLESLGRRVEAQAAYLASARRTPTALDPVLLYSALTSINDEPKKGVAELKGYLHHAPNDILALYTYGLLLEQTRDLEGARAAYERVMELNRENQSIKYELLRVLLESKATKAARLVAASLMKQSSAQYLNSPVLQEFSAGAENGAEVMRLVSRIFPGTFEMSDIRFRLATAHIQQQKFDPAIRELSLIIAADPQNALARYYRASIYAGAGDKAQALRDLDAIAADSDMYVKARSFAAVLHRQEGDLKSAAAAVRAGLKVAPEDSSLISYLVTILREQKKLGEAQKLLEQEIKRRPGDERLLFDYAVVLADNGHHERSIATMKRVVELSPNNADALNFIAYSYAEQGVSLGEAKTLVDRALALAPDNGFFLDTLGWIYYQRGDYADAVEVLRRATELSQNDIVISEHYGDALVKMGRTRDAEDIYRASMERARDQEREKSDATEQHQRLQKKIDDLAAHGKK